MTTVSINSPRRHNAQRSPWRRVVAFHVLLYAALLAATVSPAHAAPGAGHAAQVGVKDTATMSRVPGTCTQIWCR